MFMHCLGFLAFHRHREGGLFLLSLCLSLSRLTVANWTTTLLNRVGRDIGLAWHTGRQTCYIYTLSLSRLVHSYYTTIVQGRDSWLGLAYMQGRHLRMPPSLSLS